MGIYGDPRNPDVDPIEKARRTLEYQTASYGSLHGWAAAETTAVVENAESLVCMSQRVQEQCERIGLAFFDTGSDFAADMAKMAADSITQKWWDVCMPCQDPLPNKAEGEWWADMEEVFHAD